MTPRTDDVVIVILENMRFSIRQVVATPAALEALENTGEPTELFLARHCQADWGDMTENDQAANEDALVNGGRLMSAYHLSDRTKLWIITESDRSVTTILLPDDY